METFLTQDILDDLTDSSSSKNAEARGQGIGNIVSSLFGGMAGCALVGVMVMNVLNTAHWTSIRAIRRIPKSDTAVMLLTVVVTVLTHNLALGLLAGVALAGILFSRKVAKVIEVSRELLAPNHRLYQLRGQQFYVSSIDFRQGFELHEKPHPEQVTIDMSDAHIWDQSGVTALDQVIRRLKLGGSRVEVLNLNPESTDLFARIGVAEEAGGRGGSMAAAH